MKNESDAEILAHYLKASSENTKSGGVLKLKLPKIAKAGIIELYAKLRAEGTKDGFLITKIPREASGKIADLYLRIRAEGTKDSPFSLKYKSLGKGA